MKLTLTGLLAAVLLMATSCKKDKDSGPDQLSGDYKLYLMVVEDPDDGPLEYPLPSADGHYGKLVVKVNSDSSMTVNILQFDKQNNPTDQVSMTGRVTRIGNGDLRFMNGGNWLGTFGKDSELEVYPSATITFMGRK